MAVFKKSFPGIHIRNNSIFNSAVVPFKDEATGFKLIDEIVDWVKKNKI